jgi:hypothetical protein
VVVDETATIVQSLCGGGSAFTTATVPLCEATMNTWKPDINVLEVSRLFIITQKTTHTRWLLCATDLI